MSPLWRKSRLKKRLQNFRFLILIFLYEGDTFWEKQVLILIRNGRIYTHVQDQNSTMSTLTRNDAPLHSHVNQTAENPRSEINSVLKVPLNTLCFSTFLVTICYLLDG